ncbi:hypothetical protein C882_0996 [Caenispirillum salinarum AK4]|uniref:Uncharacterized protein n=1 Tax=Caenispirillum salinarum AK4 TaxID=1238182 RepID=K9GTA6_9PROT|nr:hypothetical protein C882_0996 [Caenispirillum salinarum AK4]
MQEGKDSATMTDSGRRTRKWLTAAILVLVAAGFYLSAFVLLTD